MINSLIIKQIKYIQIIYIYFSAKKNMKDDWNFTTHEEGIMDAVFLFAYAFGLYLSGYIGDYFDATRVLSFGLFLTGCIIFLFGASYPWFGIKHEYYYILLWIFNGLIQSTGWPTCVKIMGKWFGENHSGFIFGIWSANASVGNIVGAAMVSFVHDNGYHDNWIFFLPAFQLIILSLIIILFIRTEPSKWGIQQIDDNNHQKLISDINNNNNKDEETQKISFLSALLLPNVITYALCYACLKSVNYTMFFWLPYFLDGVFSEDTSDNLSIIYNVGQILGGWVCGWISDYLHRRSPPVFLFLLIAIPPIFLLRIKSHSIIFFGILSALSGFFIGGPANIISSAISADLGKHKSLMGNAAALSTVAGIIDGTGSFGAAICQYIVSLLIDVSHDLVFVILTILLFASALLISKLTVKEIKFLFKYGRKQSDEIDGKYAVQAIDK